MVGSVELVCVIGRPQRGGRPSGILRVALAHVLFDSGEVGVIPFDVKFQPPPARPFPQGRGNEQLRGGVGKYHRADVASVQDRAVAISRKSR